MVATLFMMASTSRGVPIDLTDATPTVTGATTLHIAGISTLGANYWADFKWNEKTNKFDVSAYGEEDSAPEGFVSIKPGKFMMGAPEGELGRAPDPTETLHEVTLTRGFYLSETEVTEREWSSIMGSSSSAVAGCDDCPKELMPWMSAVQYCNARSRLEGLDPVYQIDGDDVSWDQTKNGYRLPTEAEWEYACRAGTSTAFYNGEISNTLCEEPNLDEIGWYCGNNGEQGDPDYGTKEVGQKPPNAWGLYDMSGNVFEWCWDWYGDYDSEPVTDPTGPESGTLRTDRGGSWYYSARYHRSAARWSGIPNGAGWGRGCRVALSAP